jgi:sRNA-binding carbon storage regulator CsrA
MMHVDLKIGESIKIGEAILKLDDKSGKVVRLSIDADRAIPIQRVKNEKTVHSNSKKL